MDSSDRVYGYFLRDFHVLIEIYPLVPFPPSVCEVLSDYTPRVRGWGPVTSAEASYSIHRHTDETRLTFTLVYVTRERGIRWHQAHHSK